MLPQILLRGLDVATGIFLLQIFKYSVISVWPELFLLLGRASLQLLPHPSREEKKHKLGYLCFKESKEAAAVVTEKPP